MHRYFLYPLGLLALIAGIPVAQAQEPITIGIVSEMSGAVGTAGTQTRDGFLLYLKQHGNKLGGVPVKTIVEDTASDPGVAITRTRKLVELDKVDALVGPNSSVDVNSIKDYVNEHHVPTLMNGALDELTDGKYMFRLQAKSSPEWYLNGYLAGIAGYRKAFGIAPDFAAGPAAMGPLTRGIAASGGQMVGTVYPRLGTTDYSPYFSKIPDDADVAAVLMVGGDAPRFMRQYQDAGRPVPIVAADSVTAEMLLPAEGDTALGVVETAVFVSTLDIPSAKEFKSAWSAAYPNVRANWYCMSGWTMGQVYDAAITKLGGKIDDKEAFIAAIKGVHLISPPGPMHFNETNDVVWPRFIAQIQKVNGVVQPVVLATIPEFDPVEKVPTLPAGLKLPYTPRTK